MLLNTGMTRLLKGEWYSHVTATTKTIIATMIAAAMRRYARVGVRRRLPQARRDEVALPAVAGERPLVVRALLAIVLAATVRTLGPCAPERRRVLTLAHEGRERARAGLERPRRKRKDEWSGREVASAPQSAVCGAIRNHDLRCAANWRLRAARWVAPHHELIAVPTPPPVAPAGRIDATP